MRWSYDLTGAEPIERFVPVYDAALIDVGELLELGTTDPDSNADQGISFKTGSTFVDVLGISLMARNTSGPNPLRNPALPGDAVSVAAVYATNTAGPAYNKAIINPFAIYLAEYDQTDAITAASSSTTTLTVTSLEDDIDGAWIYIVTGSPAANRGSLRFLTASASGSCTMNSALPATDTGSTLIKILPVNHRLVDPNAESTGITSAAAAASNAECTILENWIRSDSHPFERLRRTKHQGLNDLSNAKFFAECHFTDHVYNQL
jgi:hypothetical protein